MRTVRWRTTFAFCLLAASLACRKQTADDRLAKGNAYFDQARYPEAIIEYRNAVQIEPLRGDVRAKLGDAYLRANDPRAALREYVRAADLLPNDAGVQLKAGNLLLVARSFEDAKGRADKALAIEPGKVDGLVLRGNAMAGLRDMDGAIAEYEDAIAADPSTNQAYLSLGAIQFAQGKRTEAEETFKKAIESDPKSIAARLALANFYWASDRRADSEAVLKAALQIEPNNADVNRVLGVFYMTTGRGKDAEPYFQTIATSAGTASAKLTLAQYFVVMNRPDDARRVLEELAKHEDSFAVAGVRLGALDMAQGRRAEAKTRVLAVLAKYPQDVSAQLFNAALLALDVKRDEAIAVIKNVIAADPRSARAYLLAGHLYTDSDRTEEAIQAYEQVLKLDPRPLMALIDLARLHLRTGAGDKALVYAQQALAIQPQNAEVHNLIARSYLRSGEIAKAKTEVAALQKAFPKAAPAYTLSALVSLAEKRPDAARVAYQRALDLDPFALEAFQGLVSLDLTSGKPKDAVARLDTVLARVKPTTDLLLVAANGYAAAGAFDKSEKALRRAIEIDPARLQPYQLLGRVYVTQHRTEDAKAQFEDVLKRNPKSVGASTMVAMLLESEGHIAEAEQQYQHTLAIDSRAAVAANNLAYILVSSNRNLDQALQLAQTAQQQMPGEPNVSDTLGWIYLKKNMASQAIQQLESSIKKTPDNAIFHYHLGMAYLQAGEFDKAKDALKQALSLKGDFDGAVDARKALLTLGA